MKKLGLYIHIPFCISKCAYCDFFSVPCKDDELIEKYISALCSHIDEYKCQTRQYTVDTIYLGGGTPSLLSEKHMNTLLKKIYSCFGVAKNAEISAEVNPGTIDLKKLKAYRKAGINRLSIGTQSFAEADLSRCGRIHSVNDNFAAVSDARKAGFENISLDIMFGLPDQNIAGALENLNTALKLNPEHISLYGLTLEEGTPFFDIKDELNLPNESCDSEMYFSSVNLLRECGYYQYEISNFAKKDRYCRHNIKYWDCEEYLGLGPGAHSYFGGKRFSFKKNLDLYLGAFSKNSDGESILGDYIDIPASAMAAEYVMLRFRLSDGIDCDAFYKRFGRTFDSIYFNRILPFLKSGHIVRTNKGYAFSVQGMYVSNYILSRIIDFDLNIPGI